MDDTAPAPAGGGQQVIREVTIVNQRGLHARASARFVKCAESFQASIFVSREGQTVGGTSIMGLMLLAAAPGARIAIAAQGPDAERALAALCELVEAGFGEDQSAGK